MKLQAKQMTDTEFNFMANVYDMLVDENIITNNQTEAQMDEVMEMIKDAMKTHYIDGNDEVDVARVVYKRLVS
jgi:hypothetical protein